MPLFVRRCLAVELSTVFQDLGQQIHLSLTCGLSNAELTCLQLAKFLVTNHQTITRMLDSNWITGWNCTVPRWDY